MSTSPFDFKGKTVFVAGGTSGINLGIAQGFARAGARLAVISRSHDKVDAAVDSLQALGAEAMGFAVDVREYAVVESALQEVHKEWGNIDVLISGAAGNFPVPALGMTANAFHTVVDIDLQGSFHVLRSAFQYLRKPGASVINISAPQAFLPMALQAHVCAAKAGVDMLTRVLALEWGSAGVRVNSICPGPIDNTEGMRRLAPNEALHKQVVDSVPLQRMGEAQDIADAAMFLSSPQASYISGVVLPVDGGWSLGGAANAFAGLASGGTTG
ncbi:MAG: SDR family oxidoreductase [Salinisphaeraceae bacterium]|nr:SDR family oxidoreductase [Salinisphaeraceae bacterium]